MNVNELRIGNKIHDSEGNILTVYGVAYQEGNNIIWYDREGGFYIEEDEAKPTSNAGIELIKRFEGLKLKPYLDSKGVPTIGIGSTYYEDGTRVKMTDPAITEERAIKLFRAILARFEDTVNHLVTGGITQPKFDALVSLVYNIGPTAFKNSTILKMVNANPCDPGIKDQFLRWNKSGGKVLLGLTRRRKAEADLYFSVS